MKLAEKKVARAYKGMMAKKSTNNNMLMRTRQSK